MKIWHWTTALALVAALFAGCDDDDDTAGTVDAGNTETDASVGETAKEAFRFTEITLTEPNAVATTLTNILTMNLNAGNMYLFVQLEGWTPEGPQFTIRGGAGQYVEGKETADIADDVFTWLTEGMCTKSDGTSSACTVEVGEAICDRDGDTFTGQLPVLNIYSDDLEVIFPIKQVDLDGTRDGTDVSVAISGVITEPDTHETLFPLVEGGNPISLATVLANANVEPDTEVTIDGETVPAFTFAGSFESLLMGFTD